MKKNVRKIIQVAKPYIDSGDIKTVSDVLKSGLLSLGPKYSEFEKLVTHYAKVKYAVAVSSGTAGLHLAVKALGLGLGDEVITSPFSFIASSNCLLYENVKPVFVDIEEDTFNIDPHKIESAITKRTKAILVVHIFGQTADMNPIMAVARKYNLAIIEDACESLGAKYRGKWAGSFGDVGVYAFYPNKQMTTGEGGMLVTKSKRIYQLCNSLRNQGRSENREWLNHVRLGYNYRMDEMSAALGTTQLKKLDWMIREKRKIAEYYDMKLRSISNIITPKIGIGRTHSWFVYVIRILNRNRNQIINKLSKMGIQTKPYIPTIHLQPFMKKMYGFKKNDFPIAEKISSQTLALPFYIGLNKAEITYICDKIKPLIS
ncbi:polysaccharide biosynthesis protein [Candidatus Roizmanbacteria bacterium RIFCSPHIGHO2_02_FULL_37_13b]|uniref:Polysaccharide biosynthesis protein n=1 Tax=Candidatus Roizmanbacteria bacterium RIFCSPLOWO2_02_FULL_36_11 TaxID=1802071 RepID=A0A1F7JIX6_9BACT|nr:MAG: polysaccharide biosynthesis protein [Candidatus Roizmanbacteria bacterium RIFCSPHIGHO2_02_FULL_37_13b]OGK55563.1 MAG: polysaccharide biosynthesis protein [Candidatus Roizmanbacteria bacterium RIFCSPLOWO2_02_FULL_36_11]